eukprot:scaffold4302_cov98-Isochrysis_galbana.AAC.4
MMGSGLGMRQRVHERRADATEPAAARRDGDAPEKRTSEGPQCTARRLQAFRPRSPHLRGQELAGARQ